MSFLKILLFHYIFKKTIEKIYILLYNNSRKIGGKMKRQTIKRIFTALFALSFLFNILSTSFASEPFDFQHYNNMNGNSDADKLAQTAMGTAINTIQIIAIGIAVIMLSYMAIKYITAAPNEKAEFKKSASIYILGAILIFAAGNILGIIVNYTTTNISAS